MSLFGAGRSTTSLKESLKRAKENLKKRMAEELPSEASGSSVILSSRIGKLLDEVTGPVTNDGTAESERDDLEQMERELHGDSEYERLRDEEKKEEFEAGLRYARAEDDLRRRENSQATSRVESGQLPSDLDEMKAYSDLTGKTGVTGITRYRSRSVGSESSKLSSPPPTTKYGGSEISFPSQTPRERVVSPLPTTSYEGSLLGLPPSALPQDPFSTPRASAGSIARKYIQSEENVSQHAEEEGGMEETRKVYTPIARKFEISDSSDEAMTVTGGIGRR